MGELKLRDQAIYWVKFQDCDIWEVAQYEEFEDGYAWLRIGWENHIYTPVVKVGPEINPPE